MSKYLDENGLLYFWQNLKSLLGGKVDKETGKGLSSNDYTTADLTKLSGIEAGAEVNIIESILVNGNAATISSKAASISVPTKTSDLTNDSNYITINDVPPGSVASTTTPKMDGTASTGSENAFARGDHVHPTDTSLQTKITASGILKGNGSGGVSAATAGTDYAAASHTHGEITNGGDITTSATIASGDRLVINDESASKIKNSSITFGTSTTSFLSNAGTWETPVGGVSSVNTKTGAVVLTTADLTNDSGYITQTYADSTYASKSSIAGAYIYKGSVATYADLPSTGLTAGDVYDVQADNMNYAWTGSAWDQLGSTFTITNISNADIDTILAS